MRAGCGTLSPRSVKHLLMQHDNRFSTCQALLFTLFNQLQRHAACSNVQIRVKNSDKAMDAFTRLVNSDSFVTDLDAALADSNSARAKTLVRKIVDVSRLVGAPIPWSQMERESAMCRMFALMYYSGPFSFFITVAPADMVCPSNTESFTFLR